MRKAYQWLILALVALPLVLSGCIAGLPGADLGIGGGGTPAAPACARYIVVFEDLGIDPAFMERAIAEAGGTLAKAFPEIGVAVAESELAGFEEALEVNPAVEGVACDVKTQWIPEDPKVYLEESLPETFSPETEPFFWDYQWNMRVIEADRAWAAGYTGDPAVEVAIVDTGLDYRHIDLQGRVDMTRSISFATYDHPFVDTYFPGEPYWIDMCFHGTHVGGIVAANGVGVSGVAPNVTLIAVKVLSWEGWGYWEWVIEGIMYAANLGVDVINMSLGPGVPEFIDAELAPLVAAMSRAINYATQQGVLVVSAVGNKDLNADDNPRLYYANNQFNSGIGVSATGPIGQTDFDRKASYSNYGMSLVNIAAPGGDFMLWPEPGWWLDMVLSPCSTFSLWFPACQTYNTGVWVYLWAAGTSMAAPHVAGIGALVDSQYGGALDAATLAETVLMSAEDLGDPGFDPIYGWGRVNAYRACLFTP